MLDSKMVADVTLIGMDNTVAMVENPHLFDLQKEAIKLYCRDKFKSNPKNTVGLSSMRQGFLRVIFDPSSDVDKILSRVKGVPLCGTLDFSYGVVYTKLGFVKRCPDDMPKRMLLFVGGPLNSDKAEMEALGRFLLDKDMAVDVVWFPDTNYTNHISNPVKKERLEAFVAAVNNNNSTSHIACLEPGCDVGEVLTRSGILTHGSSIKEERATQKNKAAVIDGPENVIPYGVMKMRNHQQTSTSGLAREAERATDGPENVIPNMKKKNQHLVNSEPHKTPFKTSQNDNMSRKGKNQVC